VIPLAVGHTKFGCNGPVGGVTTGGTSVSSGVIMPFSASGTLDLTPEFCQQPKATTNASNNLTVISPQVHNLVPTTSN